MKGKGQGLGYAACALASCFWGCGFFFGKIALGEMNSGAMVFYRFLFAMVVMVPLCVRLRPEFSGREWRVLLVSALLGVPLQFLLQFKGLSLTTVSHASLMVGTLPVMLAAAATLFAGERMDGLGWGLLATSTTGAALIVFGAGPRAADGRGPSLVGDGMCVVSLMISLGWILLNQRLLVRHRPATVSAWGLLVGFAMLAVMEPAIYGLPPVRGISLKAWGALAASGLLCTASTTLLWNWGLARVPASRAGVLLNIEPMMGSVLGVVVLGERLGGVAWVGGAMIVSAAVWMTAMGRSEGAEAVGELA